METGMTLQSTDCRTGNNIAVITNYLTVLCAVFLMDVTVALKCLVGSRNSLNQRADLGLAFAIALRGIVGILA